MVKKILIETRFCNPITHVFKGHVKIVKMHKAQFNVSILNRFKTMFFCKYEVYT